MENEIIAILPSFKPEGQLPELVQKLMSEGISVLVVDDGSGDDFAHIFKQAEAAGAKLIANPVNLGKGAALKNGFSQVLTFFPDCKGVITADSDGQHAISDILRVREELRSGNDFVITERFHKNKVPFRSTIGNLLSVGIFCALTDHYYKDNQSGLRGFSVKHLPWLVKVPGSRYDYELNVLYVAHKQCIREKKIPIEAIYIDGNSSSHFSPIKDTLRIYKRLFASAKWTFLALLLAQIIVLCLSFVPVTAQNVSALALAMLFLGLFEIAFKCGVNVAASTYKIKNRDTFLTAVFTLFHYSFTGLGVILFAKIGMFPLLAFVISLILCLVLEHYILKLFIVPRS